MSRIRESEDAEDALDVADRIAVQRRGAGSVQLRARRQRYAAHPPTRQPAKPPSNRSVKPVWTWERANRTVAVVDGQTGRSPPRREGARTGSARCSTVLARLPQRRIPEGPNAYAAKQVRCAALRLHASW